MINLTNRAEGKVKEFIQSQEESYSGVRVAVVAGGCSGFEYKLVLEQEAKDGDQVLEQDGFRIYVDEQSMLYLDGTEIDFVESSTGSGFSFNNPNSTGSCGCGESFHV
jgi:iron-sulfur cluster assembly accessory protein